MRRAAKVDTTHRPIVEALRSVGASVIDLAAVGHGVPDLLVGYRGDMWLIEVKGPKTRLSESQRILHGAWRGKPIAVIRTIDEALALIGATP